MTKKVTASPNDKVSGRHPSPLKSKYGLNGPPKALVAGVLLPQLASASALLPMKSLFWGLQAQVPPLRFASVGDDNFVVGIGLGPGYGLKAGGTTNLSSRRERTRIYCHAALINKHVCSFPWRRPHEVRHATTLHNASTTRDFPRRC